MNYLMRQITTLYNFFNSPLFENKEELSSKNFDDIIEPIDEAFIDVLSDILNEAVNILIGKKIIEEIPEQIIESLNNKKDYALSYLANLIHERTIAENQMPINVFKIIVSELYPHSDDFMFENIKRQIVKEYLEEAAEIVKKIYSELGEDIEKIFEADNLNRFKSKIKADVFTVFVMEQFLGAPEIISLMEAYKRRKKKENNKSNKEQNNDTKIEEVDSVALETICALNEFAQELFSYTDKYSIE